MVINENNSQINSFVEGMNSDHAYDVVKNSQYVFGKNIRITKNVLLGDKIDNTNYPSLHEGVITPVKVGYEVGGSINLTNGPHTILAVKSIDNIGVIITKTSSKLCVFKFEITEEEGKKPNIDESKLIWQIDITDKSKDFESVKQVSAVLYKELESATKLYIATGVYPIIEIDINGQYEGEVNVDYFINNRILPKYPIYIEDKIDGQLKTSLVLYTYRYYNKFGITTQLAPLTNKIQVIDANRGKETGNAQDTVTSIGFTLKIRDIDEHYNRMLIYRLQYINPGEDANVSLIYDGETNKNENGDFLFNDVGATPLLELTMEEFAAMSGLIIIPKVIEQNQEYLFASNVKDDTIIQDVIITDGDLKPATSYVRISDDISKPPVSNSFKASYANDIVDYFEDRNVNSEKIYLKMRHNNRAGVIRQVFTTYARQLLRVLLKRSHLIHSQPYQSGVVICDDMSLKILCNLFKST